MGVLVAWLVVCWTTGPTTGVLVIATGSEVGVGAEDTELEEDEGAAVEDAACEEDEGEVSGTEEVTVEVFAGAGPNEV